MLRVRSCSLVVFATIAATASGAAADTDDDTRAGVVEVAPGYLHAVGHDQNEIASVAVSATLSPQARGVESELLATVHLWKWLHVIGGVAAANQNSGAETTSARPFVGALLSFGNWREGGQLTLGCIMKAEGFTESESEIESSISGARLVTSNALAAAELRYGQDPEGRERDVEVAADVRWMMGAWSAGLGGRGRTGKDKMAIVRSDLMVGPDLSYSLSNHQFVLVGAGWQAQDYAAVRSSSEYVLVSYGVAR